MAGSSPDADENYVHVLAEAADGSHEAQVFRMQRTKRIKALARAYGVFRNVPSDDSSFRLSTAQHGDLDLMATAGSYGFSNGEIIVFTDAQKPQAQKPEVQKPEPDAALQTRQDEKLEQPEQQPAQESAPPEKIVEKPAGRGRQPTQQRRVQMKEKSAGQRSKKLDTGRFRRSFSAAASKVKQVARAKATPKRSAKKVAKKQGADASGQWAPVVSNYLPENMSAMPDVPARKLKSTIVKSGPAKDWSVCAYLKEFKTAKEQRHHNSVISWRISSPGRSRTFDTWSSSRGTPNLKDAVSEAVFTQITTAVKPGLAKQIRDTRCSLENNQPSARSSKSRAEEIKQPSTRSSKSSSSGVTPQKRKASQNGDSAKITSANGKNNTKRELATPARVARHQAKRRRVDAGGESSAAPEAPCKVWACGCVAHLRRQIKCTPHGDMQPPLVHIEDHMSIGRADTCDLKIDSLQAPQMISRWHALLQREDNTFVLTDQKSVNGVTVNGQRVDGKKILAHGDEITFGVVTAQPELDYVFEMNPDRR